MARVIKRTFATILPLPALKIQASNAVLADATRIFDTVASDEDIAQWARDDKFIIVRPKSFPPNPATQAGSGTAGVEIDGIFDVGIWLRLWVDQPSQDTQWLQHSTLGIAPLIDLVDTALEQYYPTDGSGDYYFIQPMRLLPPGWQFPMKRIGEWGHVTAEFSCVFHLSM